MGLAMCAGSRGESPRISHDKTAESVPPSAFCL